MPVAERLDRIADQITAQPGGLNPPAPEYCYPWTELDQGLQALQSIRLFAYGSLMNRRSAARTLTASAVRSATPAIAFGAVRRFDYVMPADALVRYGDEPTDKAPAALNAYRTLNVAERINGVLFEIGAGDLKNFREREYGYDLLPVWTCLWNADDDSVDGAYILSCRKPIQEGRQITAEGLTPHKSYVEVCLEGCRELGEGFLEYFEQTTPGI